MVLHAGCSNCGMITPLFCAGAFMPHPPVPVVATPGPYCACCGPLAPVFVCTYCWTRQGLYVPGMPAPPVPGPGTGRFVAPAVQADPSIGGGQVKQLLGSVAGEFMKDFAGDVGSQLGNQFGGDLAGAMAAWC